MEALSDEELRGKTKEFKERLKEGETLDDILPEAYAVVREGCLQKSWNAPLSSTADWWYYPASGTYRRDEELVKVRHLCPHFRHI